jgi:hypothetical protein
MQSVIWNVNRMIWFWTHFLVSVAVLKHWHLKFSTRGEFIIRCRVLTVHFHCLTGLQVKDDDMRKANCVYERYEEYAHNLSQKFWKGKDSSVDLTYVWVKQRQLLPRSCEIAHRAACKRQPFIGRTPIRLRHAIRTAYIYGTVSNSHNIAWMVGWFMSGELWDMWEGTVVQ